MFGRKLLYKFKSEDSQKLQVCFEGAALFRVQRAHQLFSGFMIAIMPEKLVVHSCATSSVLIGTPGSQLSQPSS
jgi:hypothetical protein